MQPGSRLGPYEIVSCIGAEGMGEVWRARDTRLERDVAIKILPAEFAHDAKLKIRFEREAKTISHIAHPNICTLFDVVPGFAETTEQASPSFRSPRVSGYQRGDPNRTWDISLDSRQFLMTRIEKREPTPVTKMTLVQGWFQELERILPAGRP